jgi:uncharacterized protein YceH (UPF0502 family)
LNLGRREMALICELLLRGPQTVGELKNRADRMHRFNDLEEVESVLEHMSELVTKLPRRPGEKEQRYAHLLSGEPRVETISEPMDTAPSRTDRIGVLELEVARQREVLEDLKRQLADFRRQFE